MRILLVNKFHWKKGGSETYHFAVAESLEAMGHEVAFFAMEDERNLPCRQSRYFVSPADYNGGTSPVKKVRDGIALLYNMGARRKFEQLLREFKPDVIHLNLVHRQLTFSILDAPSAKGIPVVYTAHDYIPVCPACTMLDGAGKVCDECLSGSFNPCVRKRCVKGSRAKSLLAAAEARFLRQHGSYGKIDRIIAPSFFMAERLAEGGFERDRIEVMPNFVGHLSFEGCGEPDVRHPYILYFGRLSREKGVGTLVEAFLRVAGSLPSWRLLIAGEGPEEPALRELLAADPDSGRHVELVGFRTGKTLQDLVARATLTAVPSECLENSPFAVLEALCAGTPVIGTNMGGIPELIEDGATGFLVEAGSVPAMGAAIRRAVAVAADCDAYRAMRERCRSIARERFGKDVYMERLIGLYRSLVSRKEEAR